MNADGSGASRLPLLGNVITADPAPRGQRIAYATDFGGSWSLHIAQLSGKGDAASHDRPGGVGRLQPALGAEGNHLRSSATTLGNNDVYVVGHERPRYAASHGHAERRRVLALVVGRRATDRYMSRTTTPAIRSVSLADGSVSDVNTVAERTTRRVVRRGNARREPLAPDRRPRRHDRRAGRPARRLDLRLRRCRAASTTRSTSTGARSAA